MLRVCLNVVGYALPRSLARGFCFFGITFKWACGELPFFCLLFVCHVVFAVAVAAVCRFALVRLNCGSSRKAPLVIRLLGYYCSFCSSLNEFESQLDAP